MLAENELLRAIDSIDLAINPVIGDLVRKEMIPLWESEAAARDEGKKHTITLDYGKLFKVDRVINYHEGNVKKECYPKHFKDNKWIKKLPEDRSLFPLYHEDKITFAKGKWLLIHEGEKACDYALSRDLISISFAGSLANDDDYIGGKFYEMLGQGIKGGVYLADNDDAGMKKAIKIRDNALEVDFPIVIVPIGKALWTAKKGDDFKEYSDQFPHHDGEMLKAQIESFIIESKFDLINIKDESKSTVTSEIKKDSENLSIREIALSKLRELNTKTVDPEFVNDYFIIPEILPKGDIVQFIALPKVGKSLLAYDLISCLINEQEFLGYQIKQENKTVLIIQADEPQSTSDPRIINAIGRFDNRVKIVNDFDLSKESLEFFEIWVNELKPSIIMIDSLREINKDLYKY